MFCDKENVNLLTTFLLHSEVTDIVVCPGSRNAALVHNFYMLSDNQGGKFRLHAVTDERSAGFVGIGLSLATDSPVAVCVTSGSALLNTLPAVAEAYYRQIPLLIISADRPPELIGQLDGQTLPQTDALQPFASSFTLAEISDSISRHLCCRQSALALSALRYDHSGAGRPVHINIPLAEPLFSFSTPQLPHLPRLDFDKCTSICPFTDELLQKIRSARLPVLLIGQNVAPLQEACATLDEGDQMLVLPELIANVPNSWRTATIECHPELIKQMRPDVIVHVGGNLVNKQIKLALRSLQHCEVIRLEETNETPDTFFHLSHLVRCSVRAAITQLGHFPLGIHEAVHEAKLQLLSRYRASLGVMTDTDNFTQESLLHRLSLYIMNNGVRLSAIHLANSTIVRQATRTLDNLRIPIHCNRGINGIEGSLSVAAGYALASHTTPVLMIIGDLSFFYDQNALWNKDLDGRLRILLFNNGGGSIFKTLPGLEQSPARDAYIAASHHTSASGIAQTYGVSYRRLTTTDGVETALAWLTSSESDKPLLLEVELGEH